MKKINVAMVGVGKWGKNLLAEFDKQANVLRCCHKSSDESVRLLNEQYPNIKISRSIEDVLNDSSVEAVVVATPTFTHFEIAKKVLEANKCLFLEKPACSESMELEVLCQEAEKRGLIFSVGYEFVHHPALKTLKEKISVQNIQCLLFEWNKWGTFEAPIVPHLLSHEISIIKSLGIEKLEPKIIFSQKFISEADIIEVNFGNEKNILINCKINRTSAEKNKSVTIIGTDEKYIWHNDSLLQIEPEKESSIPVAIEKTSSVEKEIEDFLKCMETKNKPKTDGNFALKVWDTLNKVTKAT